METTWRLLGHYLDTTRGPLRDYLVIHWGPLLVLLLLFKILRFLEEVLPHCVALPSTHPSGLCRVRICLSPSPFSWSDILNQKLVDSNLEIKFEDPQLEPCLEIGDGSEGDQKLFCSFQRHQRGLIFIYQL